MTDEKHENVDKAMSADRHESCEIHGSCVEPYPEPVNKDEALRMNTTSLAWLGDAVYETYVRKYIVDTGVSHADKLHIASVRFVKAEAQARIMKALLAGQTDGEPGEMNPAATAEGLLDADEQAFIRRARNKKNATRPKNADPMDYKWATAFEALIGYYYVTEQIRKLEDVILFALNYIENT
jgi:ribonuclease-3 family protein